MTATAVAPLTDGTPDVPAILSMNTLAFTGSIGLPHRLHLSGALLVSAIGNCLPSLS